MIGRVHQLQFRDHPFPTQRCHLQLRLLCIEAKLQYSTFITLTFTSQKNVVRGNQIGYRSSGYPLLCPNADLP